MNATDKFTLYTYDGDFGLASFDTECTQSILYAAIAKVPVQLKVLNNVQNCVFHDAPTFVHKNLQFKSFHDMELYLRTLNVNLDSALSAKEKSDSLAIKTLVQTKLRTVVEYVFWVDQRNCEEFTRIWYMKALPIPFNYIYTKRFKENALSLMENSFPPDYTAELMRSCVTTMATECLSSLSVRLGTSDYFCGSSPTSLDVIVYSYVAPLVKLPFPSNDVSNLITMWPNLLNFVKRIDSQFLINIPKDSKYMKPNEKEKNNDDDVSYIAISILTVSVMSLVFGFAFRRGIISGKIFS